MSGLSYAPIRPVVWLLLVGLWVLAPLAPAQQIPVKVFDRKAEEAGLDARRLDKIVDMLRREIDTGVIPNAAVYVHRNGQLGWWVEMGYSSLAEGTPIDSRSIFRLFSMTKPITAVAVMLLVDDGLVLLDDPVHKYLPKFERVQVMVPGANDQQGEEQNQGQTELEAPLRPLRVRDLLTHTDGLTYSFIPTPVQSDYRALGIDPGNPRPEGRKQPSLASMVDDLATLPLVHHPGQSWHYGVGLDVAGRLVEVVSGQGFAAFLEERLLKPLGMRDTAFFVQPRIARKRLTTLYQRNSENLLEVLDAPEDSGWAELPAVISGGGGLTGTGLDYLNFAEMLLNLGRYGKRQLLSRRAAEVMMSDQMSPSYGLDEQPWPSGYSGVNSQLGGVGQGLGGAVYTNFGLSPRPFSPGTYSWGGAAGTDFWVDRQENLAVVFLTQVLEIGPGEVDSIQDRLANLVYQALTD